LNGFLALTCQVRHMLYFASHLQNIPNMNTLTRPILTSMLALSFLYMNAQDGTKGISIKKTQDNNSGRTFALIVGISQYKNLPRLNYADVDAKDFYQYILQSSPADSANVKYFINAEATREAIVDQLYSITDKVKKGDKVYIFLSGHGDIEHLTKTDNSLFLLSESPQKNYLRKTEYVDLNLLRLNLLREFFNTWQENDVKTIFIVDACHSGALSGGEQGRNNTLLSLQQNWKNEIKMLSCQPDELSIEGERFGGGRGLFSYYLTLGLRGLADKDNNKTVTLNELSNFIRDSVSFHSDQSQIPATHGDLRYQLNQYPESSLEIAKAMLQRKIPLWDPKQFRAGKKDPIADMITDAAFRQKYDEFILAVKQNRLVKPENNCAAYFYQLFKNEPSLQSVAALMRGRIIDATQKRFYELTDKMYDDNFGTIPAIYIENVLQETSACLQLLDKNHYSYNKLMARKAFLESCNRTYYLNTDKRPAQYISTLKDEIRILEEALKADPMQPYLYLRIGDYALNTNDFEKAIANYTTYQQFLPKDEYAYNKLGSAYLASGKPDKAFEQFEKSTKINPKFAKGYYGLYKVSMNQGRTAEAAYYAKLANTYGKFPDLQDNRDLY
jgi:tetratricopeptide (TPR) repeat protein